MSIITLMPNLINIPDKLLTLIFGLTAILSSILFLKTYFEKRQSEEQVLDEEKQKSYQLLRQALRKSQDLLSEAELESIKVSSDSKFYIDKYLKEVNNQLTEHIKKTESSLTQMITVNQQAMAKAQQDFTAYLSELKTRSDQSEFMVQETSRKRISQLFDNFETRLSNFLVQTEQQSMTSIELELRSARQLIDIYKTQQLRIVDENVVAMLEKTLNIVLTKKLTLKDQMDLVYESLEKAKAEKFIV